MKTLLAVMIAVVMSLTITTSYARDGVMKQGARIIRTGDSKYDMLCQFGEPRYRDYVGELEGNRGSIPIEKYVYDYGMWRYEITTIGSKVVSIKKIRLRVVR